MDLLGAVDAVLMQMDREEGQKFALTAIYKSIASPPAGRNFPRSHQTFRKKGNSGRAKRTVLHLILRHQSA